MNPSKIEEDLFHHLGPPPILHDNHQFIGPGHHQPQPPIDDDAFSLAEIDLFRDDEEDDDVSRTSSDAEIPLAPPNGAVPARSPNLPDPPPPPIDRGKRLIQQSPLRINPEPHVSAQFYTFNKDSHALMIRCLIGGRTATPDEIRAVTPAPLLSTWRSVWKDRNEDTAYLTAWKRIQDKLTVHVSESAASVIDNNCTHFLCFKNNLSQFVSHIDQWQDIVMSYHGDADFQHLGLKDTTERIKQVWTVGAKYYGIPESYIRTCLATCPLCLDESSGCAPKSKKRKFEYTESLDVPAKEVQTRLQQLAAKHKVVLCIRQKYIRYKPFMAEVKDYACHRAGEPAKKPRFLKREQYASKRCGCQFRIRAIVPISNYNDKEKTFVYEEEGTAVFKLYAVHSGHEPGPLDGNARIMHRVLGHKGGVLIDQETVYGMAEDGESEGFRFSGKNLSNLQSTVLHQVQELRNELGLLEGRIGKMPSPRLDTVSRELFQIVNRLRNIVDDGSKSVGLLQEKQDLDDVLVVEHDLPDWVDDHHTRIYGDGKDADGLEDDEASFGRTLGEVASWNQMRIEGRKGKDILSDNYKAKWLKCDDFDQKGNIGCSNPNMINHLRHDEIITSDVEGLVGIQVNSLYPENPKWLDSPGGLDAGADCGDGGFRHGEIM
ncbi:hypothetical protein STAS_02039 [Striga asiatica]|uniref:Uncharacterized protein n=1 Tax=Striga asiatica TaxID=4170 RepID=A0A5A7P0Q5_STRAF|nr:hypothetical protein STAS_02039 [Striga asiatica]